jgi:taurine dioxygenase
VSEIRIEPVAGALGAEVLGVDLGRPLSDATFATIRAAFLAHGVLFFRDLDVPRHNALASRFGKLSLHPNIQGSKADPAVIDIVRNPGDTKIIGEDWHSDTAHVECPPMGSVLSRGGDCGISNVNIGTRVRRGSDERRQGGRGGHSRDPGVT